MIINRHFIIFCFVGIVNNLINFGVFFTLLTYFGVKYTVAGIFGFISGALSGYILNRKHTFQSKVSFKNGLIRYLYLQCICLIISVMIQFVSVNILEIKQEYSQIPSILITILINYNLIKFFVFKG